MEYVLKGCHTQKKFIQTNYPKLYDHMINDLPAELSWGEKLYWVKNDIHTYPTCPICGSKVNFCEHNSRYYKFCSVKCMANSTSVQSKMYHTKKNKNNLNSSKLEKDVKEWLERNHINFKYQYKSEEYPFNCDFYFPDKNLYLEIQGSWTHGNHPYDKNNKDDQKIVEEWKNKNSEYYNNAIYNWTVRDVNKRKYAKKHNLNFCELFQPSFKQVIDIIGKN